MIKTKNKQQKLEALEGYIKTEFIETYILKIFK